MACAARSHRHGDARHGARDTSRQADACQSTPATAAKTFDGTHLRFGDFQFGTDEMFSHEYATPAAQSFYDVHLRTHTVRLRPPFVYFLPHLSLAANHNLYDLIFKTKSHPLTALAAQRVARLRDPSGPVPFTHPSIHTSIHTYIHTS